MKKNGHFPLLLVLFSASGCSALIYEIVWYQMLQLVIGSTSVSLGVLLATFMGGLCIGSVWLPRIKSNWHPLKIYAALEAGIGIFALLVQLSFPYLNSVYLSGARHGMTGMLLRGLFAAICMLPSTILMGASLPAIVRGSKSTLSGVSWWGLLYGGNTAGAVFGCLFAGFYLLRLYTMSVAAGVAVAINLAVALVAFLASTSTSEPRASASELPAEPELALPSEATSRPLIYFAIALSGATALGAEVVWTRLLGMLLLGTVYVFSMILATFLVGIAIGSTAGSWLVRRVRAQTAFGWCQILLVFGIAWTAYCISSVLPGWKDQVLDTLNPWRMYALDLKRILLAVLPPSLFWGASFPLACAAAARPGEDSSRATGRIYAANTLGGIVGALLVSLILIPWIGSQRSERVLLVTTAIGGLLVLFPVLRKSTVGMAELAASLIVAVMLARSIGPIPGELIAYGRFMNVWAGLSTILYSIEGRNSSVAISQWNDGTIFVNVNGHVEATTEPADMKLQRMVGHLPLMLHPNPKSVLGIGFGAGVTAGTFTRHPSVEKITICEIEPVIPPTSTRYFGAQNYKVALDPRTHIVFDDARHFLLTETEKFDVIASDPLDVFIKGTAALYTKEYFESIKQHLNPGGLFSLYVPLYETDEPTIKSELATFFEAFPNGTIWANTRDGRGYDMIFMGQADPLQINVDDVDARFRRADYGRVLESLHEIGVNAMPDLFSSYIGNASSLHPWTQNSPINTDADLKLSYMAGWGINSKLEDYLYLKMVDYPPAPEKLFVGSKENLNRFLTVWNWQRDQIAQDQSGR